MTTSLRVAAIGDLHCTRASEGAFQPLLAGIAESADVLVLCGDLTDYGTPDEARVLAKELGFVYPSERRRIPEPLMRRCLEILAEEMRQAPARRICRGPLLSRAQYLVDVQLWGYEDARLLPQGSMREEDASAWTAAIDETESRPIGVDALGESPA